LPTGPSTPRPSPAWPALDEFNWALDWFDAIAAEHPERLALRVVGDDGSDEALSYAKMAARSAQVANWLRGLGVRRGDHVLLMLGNIVPLWEIMLAAMKLGAVIIPASTLLQPADLADRISRGHVRHVIAEASSSAQLALGRTALGRTALGRTALAAGMRTRIPPPRRSSSPPTGPPRRATRCSSTSPRGRPPSRSWSATRT
jgi:acetyl-CoA synthetase